MSTLKLLTEARNLISDPARWTQNSQARDRLGNPVDLSDSAAVCWCSIGAVQKVFHADPESYPTNAQWHAYRVLDAAAEEKEEGCPAAWMYNDKHTHAEVLALWDRAINTLRGT